jgi:glutaredoxin
MAEPKGHVAGRKSDHRIAFYGLSTCIWCRRTRQFLEEQGVEFDFAYVDLLQDQELEEAMKHVVRWNPASSYPTIVVDDERCVVGYQPDSLKEVLGL